MSNRVLRVANSAALLEEGVVAIRQEQRLPSTFPDDVVAAAVAAARSPRLPDLDRTDLPFVTIDPVGAMDLDQAMHLVRDGDGYLVHYAIADVAAFVEPGGPIDTEARLRGESLYGADDTIPLHPPQLSEAAASLLPDQVRPAFLWTIRLDADGHQVEAEVERARVRSRARLDYVGVQRSVDDGTADEVIQLLREVGELRLELEAERGGVSLPMPEQVIDCSKDPWTVEFRAVLPVETWNAQISLLTGFAAASLMVRGSIGVLRTLPPPENQALHRLRRTARGLGIDWPEQQQYPDFIRSLDPTNSHHLAMITACTTLLRGAGYVTFDGSVPDRSEHAALATQYAHVTAPLRRLVDRYGLEVCAALCAGTPVPDWVREGLAGLPDAMRASGHRASAYESAVLNLVEAASLAGRVGDSFTGVVVEADHDDPRKGDVVVRDVGVTAPISGGAALPLGEELPVVLAKADPATRTVRFHPGPAPLS